MWVQGEIPAFDLEAMLDAGWVSDEESQNSRALFSGLMRSMRRFLHRGNHT
jgi:hypothetical protein